MYGYDFHKAFTKILINIRGIWVKGLGPKTGPIWPNSENVRNFSKIFFSTSTVGETIWMVMIFMKPST